MLRKIFVPIFGAALLLLSACGSASETPTAEAPAAAPVAANTPSATVGSPLTVTSRGPLDSPIGTPDVKSISPTNPTTDTATLIREAQVESVTVQIQETAPVQVKAIVSGILGDGCTSIHDVTQRQEGSTFYITVRTQRPADAMCTQVVKNYEETVTLETTNMAASATAGDYIISANGVTTTFKLP